MSAFGPTLETERLILRPPIAVDFEAWAAFAAEEETNRFLGGAKPRAAAWLTLCETIGIWSVRGYAMFSMIDRNTGEWIGRTGPWMPEGWPGTEVGWGVKASAAGKGYAHEAAVASIDYAFDVLGWSDVIHTIDPENTRSIALAERLGSTNLGPTRLPEPYVAFRVDAYGQSRTQWHERRAG